MYISQSSYSLCDALAYGKMTSQLHMTVDPKPNIVMNLKFLLQDVSALAKT
jgi:hypothetical protein